MNNTQKDLIREVFLRNGFTIKDGRDDLADYVYAAAHDLLQAVPAVQREPVAFCEDAALSIAERTFRTEVDEHLANDIIQYAQRLHSLYTTPQPAEQQPEPISRNLRAVHAMILSALDRDAADGKAVRGEMAAELRSALSEQQPAPDVSELVDALELAHMALIGYLPSHRNNITDAAISHCEQALADYRKGDDV